MCKKIILIPDVHGRNFWKPIVNQYKGNKEIKIVFLGDYLDPYNFEGITESEAVLGFKEILELARENDNIILLLGNHDIHYFPPFHREWGCRRIDSQLMEIAALFDKNFDLFRIAYSVDINGVTYLMTHAGVKPEWFYYVTGKTTCFGGTYSDMMDLSLEAAKKLNVQLTADGLNSLITSTEGLEALWLVSYERGGSFPWGSCIWADVHEHFTGESIPNTYQIFSHTFSYPDLDTEYIDSKIAMLDCRKAFTLDCETGTIEKL